MAIRPRTPRAQVGWKPLANAYVSNDLTPLTMGTGAFNLSGVTSLIACAGGKLNLEAGSSLNHATALGVACYMSTTAVIQALVDAGASAISVNDNGGNKYTDV